MAGTFNFRYKEKYSSRACVVKYRFGSKYFIWKAQHLKQSCDQVFRDLNNKIAKYKMGTLSTGDLFYKVAEHCHKGRVIFAMVEVLLETEDRRQLIDFEKAELMRVAHDKNCLNLSGDQYLPAWLQNVTQNKAPQSTITPAPVSIHDKAPEIKTTVQKRPPVTKSIAIETSGFDPAEILRQMTADKNK